MININYNLQGTTTILHIGKCFRFIYLFILCNITSCKIDFVIYMFSYFMIFKIL